MGRKSGEEERKKGGRERLCRGRVVRRGLPRRASDSSPVLRPLLLQPPCLSSKSCGQISWTGPSRGDTAGEGGSSKQEEGPGRGCGERLQAPARCPSLSRALQAALRQGRRKEALRMLIAQELTCCRTGQRLRGARGRAWGGGGGDRERLPSAGGGARSRGGIPSWGHVPTTEAHNNRKTPSLSCGQLQERGTPCSSLPFILIPNLSPCPVITPFEMSLICPPCCSSLGRSLFPSALLPSSTAP